MIKGVPDQDFIARLKGSALVTAQVVYRMPDYQNLLQFFWWQHLDELPRYPRLTEFLDYWEKNLDGPIHSVEVCHVGLLTPVEFRMVNGPFLIH